MASAAPPWRFPCNPRFEALGGDLIVIETYPNSTSGRKKVPLIPFDAEERFPRVLRML